MKDRLNELIAWVCNGLGITLTALQTEAVFRVISLILTIFATLLSIALTLWTWYRKAKEDGKITPEEVEDLKNKLEDKAKEIEEKGKK